MSVQVADLPQINQVHHALQAQIDAGVSYPAAVDDHRRDGGTIRLAGVAIMDGRDPKEAIALADADSFSVNRLYVSEDGDLHLSRVAVGGVLEMGGSLEESVSRYNGEVTSPSMRLRVIHNFVD